MNTSAAIAELEMNLLWDNDDPYVTVLEIPILISLLRFEGADDPNIPRFIRMEFDQVWRSMLRKYSLLPRGNRDTNKYPCSQKPVKLDRKEQSHEFDLLAEESKIGAIRAILDFIESRDLSAAEYNYRWSIHK